MNGSEFRGNFNHLQNYFGIIMKRAQSTGTEYLKINYNSVSNKVWQIDDFAFLRIL